MTAAVLIDDLLAGGFELAADGKRLTVAPASKLTADQRAQIRALLPDLVDLLEDRDPLRWLRAFVGRDVVPAAAVLDAAVRIGFSHKVVAPLAEQWLVVRRGSGGQIYWSRPWAPANINALFRPHRADQT